MRWRGSLLIAYHDGKLRKLASHFSGPGERQRSLRLSEEQLWAPWRLPYIVGHDAAGATQITGPFARADADCFLCRAVVDDADRENLVVYRTAHSICVLNRYPYNNGHVLVAPRLHKGHLKELTADEHADNSLVIARLVNVLEGTDASSRLQHRLECRAGRGGGTAWPSALAHCSALEWRHEFHVDRGRHESHPAGARALWELLTDALREDS